MDFVDNQRQVLADQLRKYQAQAQTQAPEGRMVGRVYVAPNPLEYLAAGLRGYGGMKGEQQTQQAMTDLQAKRQAALQEALRGFKQDMEGQPAIPATDVADGPGQTFTAPETPAVPSNPLKAFGRFTDLDNPAFQQFGMQGMATTAAEQQKRAQLAAEKEAERQRITAIMNNPNLTPQQKIALGIPEKAVDPNFGRAKGIVVNGRIVDPYAVGTEVPKQPEPFTLSPGATRFGPDNKPVASVADPNKPFNPDGTPNAAYQKYSLGKAKAGATTVDARSYNTQESEQSKTYGKSVGEMRAEIQKAGLAAPSKLARLSRMEQLLAGVDGGAAAPAMAEISSFANSIGVKIDPKLGNKQAAQALAVEMALAMRQPGSGASTDKDFDNWMTTVPDLSKTAEGRKEIIKTMRAGIEREQRAAKFAREYAKANNGVIDDEFFDTLAEWYAQNPVITPNLPATNSRGQAFDPDKERRYQEWLKRQGGK